MNLLLKVYSTYKECKNKMYFISNVNILLKVYSTFFINVKINRTDILQSNASFLIIFIPIIRILLISIYFILAPNSRSKEKNNTTPDIFISVADKRPKSQLILQSGVSFSTDDGNSNEDITFYIPLYEDDNLIFVPVISVDNITFKADLTKSMFIGKAIPNNQRDSEKAIEKAIILFKKSELCVCDLKQIL